MVRVIELCGAGRELEDTTVTLAAAATADNTYKVVVLEP